MSEFNESDYALVFAINVSRYTNELARMRESLSKKRSKDKLSSNVAVVFNRLGKVFKNVSSNNIFISHTKHDISYKIIENIQERMLDPKNYPNGLPRRMYRALMAEQSNAATYDQSSQQFLFGIGHIPTLIEETSIFVDREGEPYDPPQDYGEIESFFEFHEYTGAGKKQVFRSDAAEWWVTKVAHPPYANWKGGYRATPVFKFFGKQFTEDRNIIRHLPENVTKFIVREALSG